MTNVSGTPRKRANRRGLFEFGVETLEKEGWSVSRVLRGGKSSLREITRGRETHRVSIRTSQDAWIAFPRKSDGSGWVTLDDVAFVIAVSVDERHDPSVARVHMIPGDDARSRFDKAYAARQKAEHTLHAGRGIWLSLYDKDANNPVSHVGAGMGLDYPALATLDLKTSSLPNRSEEEASGSDDDFGNASSDDVAEADTSLTISEAKRRLSLSLGVPESAIKISIEH